MTFFSANTCAKKEDKMSPEVTIAEFQRQIERIYYDKDSGRGLEATFMWFTEEVGELSRALRRGQPPAAAAEEFSDVLAWLCTLASLTGVEMAEAAAKYANGCPKCHSIPCRCPEPDKYPSRT